MIHNWQAALPLLSGAPQYLQYKGPWTIKIKACRDLDSCNPTTSVAAPRIAISRSSTFPSIIVPPNLYLLSFFLFVARVLRWLCPACGWTMRKTPRVRVIMTRRKKLATTTPRMASSVAITTLIWVSTQRKQVGSAPYAVGNIVAIGLVATGWVTTVAGAVRERHSEQVPRGLTADA